MGGGSYLSAELQCILQLQPTGKVRINANLTEQFFQDGTLPNLALAVRDYLDNILTQHQIGRRVNTEWLTHSPNTNVTLLKKRNIKE